MKNEHERKVEDEYNANLNDGPVNVPHFQSKESVPFSILKEDAEGAHSYYRVDNCAFTRAFKRQFPRYSNVRVVVGSVDVLVTGLGKVAEISDVFSELSFIDVKSGKEFHTTITFI